MAGRSAGVSVWLPGATGGAAGVSVGVFAGGLPGANGGAAGVSVGIFAGELPGATGGAAGVSVCVCWWIA